MKPGLSNPSAAWLPIHQPTYRHNAAQELETVIREIRSLLMFESFLKEPSEGKMKAAAAGGPIVVVNASKYGCDAVIIRIDNITVHPLTNISMADIEDKARNGTSMSSLKSDVLEWLWDEITKPLLDTLGCTSCPGTGTWPRIR